MSTEATRKGGSKRGGKSQKRKNIIPLATPACPTQISVLLDSGMFLEELTEGLSPYCRIGYFAPEFKIYGDWKLVKGPDLRKASTNTRMISFRVINKAEEEKKKGVYFMDDLLDNILLRKDIYAGADFSPPVIETRFDWIFNFNYGIFRCSSVKNRAFKQVDGRTNLINGERHIFENIAHDVVIHYELEQGDRLEIVAGDQVLWSSADPQVMVKNEETVDVVSRFDIEVIAPHATAENYFRDALDHKGNDYWLPNQGDPDPVGGKP